MGAENVEQRRDGARAIAVAMLDGGKGPRRNRHRKTFQGAGRNSVGADARGEYRSAGSRQDRGENRLVRRQFDGDIQVSVRDAERFQGLDKGSPRSGASLS